jgi:hypothetical protein
VSCHPAGFASAKFIPLMPFVSHHAES